MNERAKLLPQDLDAERAVLGAMLAGFISVADVRRMLAHAGLFNDELHQRVYAALLHLDNAGQPVDRASVNAALKVDGTTAAEVTELENFARELCVESMAGPRNWNAHAERVRDIAIRRELAATAREAYLDACDGRGSTADIANALQRHTARAQRTEADAEPESVAEFRPLPVELLPGVLARYITSTADAQFNDPAMVALPVLATVGAAIGTTRAILLKIGWEEYPIIWTCNVARSGANKTAAFKAATEPLEQAEYDARKANESATLEYNEALAAHKALKPRERAQNAEPKPPRQIRYTTADATTEALAAVLQDNPRGVLTCVDELAALFKGFNAYRSGGRGPDRERWLQLWQAGTLNIDRKAEPKHIYVSPAAVSLCGCMQPGVFEATFGAGDFDSGLVARILFARPPQTLKRMHARHCPGHVREAYHDCIRKLLTLQPADETGKPVALPLTPDAAETWAEWYDAHARRQHEAASDAEAAALAKMEAYAARFALVFTLVEHPAASAIDGGAIRRGCGLADWFVYEAARILAGRDATPQERDARELIAFIERRGGEITVADFRRRAPARFRGANAEPALVELVRLGHGEWDYPRPAGRPSKVFRLRKRCAETLPNLSHAAPKPPATIAPAEDSDSAQGEAQEIDGSPDDTEFYAGLAEAEAGREAAELLPDLGSSATDWATR